MSGKMIILEAFEKKNKASTVKKASKNSASDARSKCALCRRINQRTIGKEGKVETVFGQAE